MSYKWYDNVYISQILQIKLFTGNNQYLKQLTCSLLGCITCLMFTEQSDVHCVNLGLGAAQILRLGIEPPALALRSNV